MIRGVDPTTGESISYTGSTTQELKKRFGKHKYNQLINAESTTIDVQKVSAEVDVAASGRGTLRSAKNEAVRSLEETTRNQVSKEPARPLNEVKAATEENAAAWAKRHNVEAGESFTYKSAGAKPGANATVITESATGAATAESATGATASPEAAAVSRAGRVGLKGGGAAGVFIGLALIDAYTMAREQAEAKYVMAPYLLEDEGGVFTLEEEGLIFKGYQKRYVEGDRAGDVVPIEKSEFRENMDEAKALWGHLDSNNEWVPGKLRKELPAIQTDGTD